MIEVDRIARYQHYVDELAKSPHGHHRPDTITQILRLLLEDRLSELRSLSDATRMAVCPWCGESDKVRPDREGARTCGYCGHAWSTLKEWAILHQRSSDQGGHK